MLKKCDLFETILGILGGDILGIFFYANFISKDKEKPFFLVWVPFSNNINMNDVVHYIMFTLKNHILSKSLISRNHV